MKTMKCSELVFDGKVYPRAGVDNQHVSYIAHAIEAGATMPPVIVCKRTNRIIDGVHRVRARQKLYGPDAEVDVVEKTYRNDKELFLDAIRYNSSHGRNLTTYDRAHCSITAANLGIDTDDVADAMHVDSGFVGELLADRSAMSGTLHVPIKRTIAHKAGEPLTKKQVAVNDKLSGMNQLFNVNQIIMLIESDLLDTGNEELLKGLRKLHTLLDGVLAAR